MFNFMVGITIHFNKGENRCVSNISVNTEKLSRPCINETIYKDKKIHIVKVYYENYPIITIERDSCLVIMEGLIYNYNENYINDFLDNIKGNLLNDENIKSVHDFIDHADGEFIIYVYYINTNDLVILNDSLGRLPIFYYKDCNNFIISRDMDYILKKNNNTEIDNIGLYEYLLFGINLGEKTLFKNVHRLPPNSILHYNNEKHTINNDVSRPYFCYEYEISNISYDESISMFLKLFKEGLKNRVNKTSQYLSVIQLSGGLDSRGTLSGLYEFGIKPSVVTYNDISINSTEVRVAKEISKHFGFDIKTIDIKNEYDKQWIDLLISIKCGLNHVGMAKYLKCNDEITKIFGDNIVIFSGLYGGEFTRYLDITGGLFNTDDLVNYLCCYNPDKYRCSINDVSKLLNFPKTRFMHLVKEHLEKYSEKDVYKKYQRFTVEKHMHYAGDGEDRVRQFAWTISPYFSLNLFKFFHSIPEKYKGLYFFRDFLKALNEDLIYLPVYSSARARYGISLNDDLKLYIWNILEKIVRISSLRRMASFIISMPRKIKKVFNKQSDEKIEKIKNEIITLSQNEKNKSVFNSSQFMHIINKENNMTLLLRIYTTLLTFNKFVT